MVGRLGLGRGAARVHRRSGDGGCENLAGLGNPLSGPCSPAGLESVSGGEANTTTGLGSSISGGYANAATASDASILGGVGNTLNAKCATLPDSGQSCP